MLEFLSPESEAQWCLEESRDRWSSTGSGRDLYCGHGLSEQEKLSYRQTAKAQMKDLASVVSASGEVKPKTYVNIGANAFGKITKLYVKEGQKVKKGQMLAQLENVQSSADVNATRASLDAAATDAVAADAALRTSLADLNRAKSDYERAKLDWERAQGLYKAALIAKSEYDASNAAWQTADAG